MDSHISRLHLAVYIFLRTIIYSITWLASTIVLLIIHNQVLRASQSVIAEALSKHKLKKSGYYHRRLSR
ncbi:hypothetical protein DSUL_100121 [Desulfovibrionales bacterium]